MAQHRRQTTRYGRKSTQNPSNVRHHSSSRPRQQLSDYANECLAGYIFSAAVPETIPFDHLKHGWICGRIQKQLPGESYIHNNRFGLVLGH